MPYIVVLVTFFVATQNLILVGGGRVSCRVLPGHDFDALS